MSSGTYLAYFVASTATNELYHSVYVNIISNQFSLICKVSRWFSFLNEVSIAQVIVLPNNLLVFHIILQMKSCGVSQSDCTLISVDES